MNLDRLLGAMEAAGAPYAFIGAAARNAWAPPRASSDLDFAAIVDETAYLAVVRELAAIGYATEREHRSDPADPVPAVAIFRNDGETPPLRQVDLLVAHTPFEREAVRQAVRRVLGNLAVPVIRREHLIVYKLIAWRPRDRQDIADVLATTREEGVDLDLGLIRRWAEEWQVSERLDEALRE